MRRDSRPGILLAHEMPDHEKIAPLSDAAFRAIIRAWCYCSRLETDGRVPDVVWRGLASAKVRRELMGPPVLRPGASPLVVQRDGFVECHDYVAHQRSAAEIGSLRETRGIGGAAGAHVRWHVLRRQADPDCELCKKEGVGV